MSRLAAPIALAVLVVLGLWLWLDRGTNPPSSGTPAIAGAQPPNAASSAVPAEPAVSPDAVAPERTDGAPGPDAQDYTVRGFVLPDRRAPDLTGVRVLAYRGEELDYGGVLASALGATPGQRPKPTFVLDGDPLTTAPVAADGSFELHTRERHLRLAIDHDLYLLATPEVVHVPPKSRVAEVTLSPLLGGMLQGRLLGDSAGDVEHVRLTLEPDPMAVMRDSRALMAAMLAAARPPAVPRADRTFVFRAVTPGASIVLSVDGGAAAGRSHEAALAAGEVRDIVLAVSAGLALRVEVVDEHDRPVAKALVSVKPTNSGATGFGGLGGVLQTRREHSGDDGRCTFANLLAGSYAVDALAAGLVSSDTTVDLRGGDAPAGVRLALREGGTVSGTVLAPGGKPVAGARVAHQPAVDVPVLGDMTTQLGPQVLEAVAREGVETDADGHFRLAGLADDGTFLVVAAHADYSVGIARDVRMGETGVTVELQPFGGVHGRVLHAGTGQPVTEFTAALLRTSFMVMQLPVRREVVRAADGAFDLGKVPFGDYTLQIEADGASPLQQTIKVADEEPLDVGTLQLPQAARVRGIVRSETGEPVRGALVQRRRGALADNPMLAMFQSETAHAYTDAAGHFELQPIEPGRLQLLANAEGYASGRSERLDVQAGQIVDGVLIELGHGGSVRGRLVLGPGQQPTDFLLLVQHQVTQSTQGADLADDGSFEVANLDPGGYVVQAMPQQVFGALAAPDWKPGKGLQLGEMMRKLTDNIVSQRCAVRTGETTEVTLDASDVAIGSRWSVRVQIGGQPLSNGIVEAMSLDDGTLRVAMLHGGEAVFGRMQPGPHRLQVRSGLSMTPVGPPQDLSYPSGVESHESTLSLPGGELKGRVVDASSDKPLPNAIVRLLHDGRAEQDDPIGMCLTNGDGEFAFVGLADGSYSLIAAEPPLGGTGNSASRQSGVLVTAGRTTTAVELRARPAGAASVLVTGDDGRPLAGATVMCVDDDGHPLGALGLSTTGADGRAWFGGMANGPARVVGRAPGYAPAASSVQLLSPGQAAEFALTMTAGTPTRLTVVDASGAKLRGATLAGRWRDSPWLPAMLLVRAVAPDGTFDLGPLGAGEWEFRASHPAFGSVTVQRSLRGSAPVTIVVGGP